MSSEWREKDRRTLAAEELARDVKGLGADDNNLLTVEELLSHDTGEAAEEVTFAVNDDLRRKRQLAVCSILNVPTPMFMWCMRQCRGR